MCPNHSYGAACHCSTTRDVALDAFNSKLFFFGHLFFEFVWPKLASWTASAAISPPSAANGHPPQMLCFVHFSKVRTTYRSALTKCAQITHIVPPVTVQPLAMWLSMHLIQNLFLWAPIFRVCVTQNGNLDGIRGHTHTRVCIAICIQRPIARCVMGGGWELFKQ